MIELTHSAAEGSLAHGTARGDGSAPILKANGWRWSRSLDAWYQPQSRDREPRALALEHTRDQLTAAGLQSTLTIDADQIARENEQRAEIAHNERARRRTPLQVARRIANLEREQRTLQRSIDGYTNSLGDIIKPSTGAYRDRLERELQTAVDQLSYWQRVWQAQVNSGEATDYSRDVIAKGDSVEYRGRWYEVVRANPKSVSVRSQIGVSWTETLPYAELTGHRPASR